MVVDDDDVVVVAAAAAFRKSRRRDADPNVAARAMAPVHAAAEAPPPCAALGPAAEFIISDVIEGYT